MGQDDWLKNPTKAPLKLPQFINYYKRTKLTFAKPPTPVACSIDKSPLMPHLCPTSPWGGGGGCCGDYIDYCIGIERSKLIGYPPSLMCSFAANGHLNSPRPAPFCPCRATVICSGGREFFNISSFKPHGKHGVDRDVLGFDLYPIKAMFVVNQRAHKPLCKL